MNESAGASMIREERQEVAATWARNAFGVAHVVSLPQRGLRTLEEAIELAQACDVDVEQAVALVRFVYSRPKGALAQELGGVGLCLLVLAEAAGLSADVCEADELARVLAKPLKWFEARNEAKNAAGFDADAYPVAAARRDALAGGTGVLRTAVGADGEVTVSRVDPVEFVHDPRAAFYGEGGERHG